MSVESIPGPAGALQVLVELPAEPPRALAILCHPHPLHGGTLNNKVVHQLSRTLRDLGAVSVRFNFRGVGESDGAFDQGHGELQDLLTVADWAQARWPQSPLWLAGFSFGGYVALQGAERLRPQRLVTVAPAVTYFEERQLDLAGTDWLLIQGADDDVVPAQTVLAWSDRQRHQPTVALIERAGHFFHGRLNTLKEQVNKTFAAA